MARDENVFLFCKNLIMTQHWTRILLILTGLLMGSLLLVVVWGRLQKPSHDREWELGQERLPVATMSGHDLVIDNVRNFTWWKEGASELADGKYEARVYHLDQIQGVDVFISHFSSFEGLAHIFLSFTFADSDPLVLSVESRREVGESFSPLLGLFSQYELMVVAGRERDLVGVRTHIRDERVYRYPTVAKPQDARQLLLSLVGEIQAISLTPQFYNTISNNCTNFVTRQVETISATRFPRTWKTLLPGYFDTVLRELNLIRLKSDTSWDKEVFRVRGDLDPADPAFSIELRKP